MRSWLLLEDFPLTLQGKCRGFCFAFETVTKSVVGLPSDILMAKAAGKGKYRRRTRLALLHKIIPLIQDIFRFICFVLFQFSEI